MKKYLEFIGILFLTIISFYYVDKVVKLSTKKDPLMIEIEKQKEVLNKNCTEGYITKEGVVLSKDGREVNTLESYFNMDNKTYDETKVVYNEIKCKINTKTIKDNYIISSSKEDKAVYLFLIIDDIEYLKETIDKIDNNLTLLVNGKTLKENIEYLKDLSTKGYTLGYIYEDTEDFKIYDKYIKKINEDRICVTIKEESCPKDYIKIKINNYYMNDIYTSTIKSLENGSFYLYRNNKKTVEKLPLLIKYIKAKNLDIKDISVLLK